MRSLVGLLLAGVLLPAFAGCAEPDAAPGPIDSARGRPVEDVVGSAAPGRQSDSEGRQERPVGEGTTLSNIRAFHWASNATLGDTAVEFQFRMPEADCGIKVGVTGRTAAATRKISILETDDEIVAWSLASGGPLVRAHAGSVDTDEILGDQGFYSSISGFSFQGHSSVRLTLAARGVQPWGASSRMPTASLALSAECAGEFDLVSVLAGSQVLLAGAADGEGGVGVTVLSNSVNVQDSAGMDVTGPLVRAIAGSLRENVARVLLDHPGGSNEWVWPAPDPGYSLEGEAGRYEATFDFAGDGSLWITVFGLDEAWDLDEGMLAESVFDTTP